MILFDVDCHNHSPVSQNDAIIIVNYYNKSGPLFLLGIKGVRGEEIYPVRPAHRT